MKLTDFEIRPGVAALVNDRKVQVSHVIDLSSVLVRNLDTGEATIEKVADLLPLEGGPESRKLPALESISQRKWALAKIKYQAIEKLLANHARTRKDVEEVARQHSVHPATIYSWISKFRETLQVSSLVRASNQKTRLDSRVEQIVIDVIEEFGLTEQRLKPKRLAQEVNTRCRALKLKAPHFNTIKLRIARYPRKKFTEARFGSKAAEKYNATPGKYEEAKWPLAIVQIDHTPLDIIIVDDKHRKPIGRAWITLAIDVYSRMVVGFYICLEAPGNHSIGPCLSQAMLPKDSVLAKFNIKSRWPVWGPIGVVHADNAGEFRGDMLKRACENRGFDIIWRPVKKARYGAHIERLNGTLNRSFHEVSGTTFSNTKDRGEYDSDGMAIMTQSEVEEWAAVRILDIYHIQRHGGINITPLTKYESAFMAKGKERVRGLPPRIRDERRLRIEFLPYELRTVQTYGVRVDGITYFSDVLRTWVNSPDVENPKRKRKFYIHRDYRDLSAVYFFDPETNDYYDIPYANLNRQAVSYWEVKRAEALLKREGELAEDEEALFAAIERLRAIEEQAAEKTKAARRNVQKRASNDKSLRDRPTPTLPKTTPFAYQRPKPGAAADVEDDQAPRPFDDLGDLNG